MKKYLLRLNDTLFNRVNLLAKDYNVYKINRNWLFKIYRRGIWRKREFILIMK